MHAITAINHVFSFLGDTLPDNVAIDLARLVFVVFGTTTAMLAFRIAYERKFFVFWGAATLLVGTVIIELQQLGERFTPWRLPIFWAGAILVWMAIRKVIREW